MDGVETVGDGALEKALPVCPACGATMRLNAVIPAFGGLPELRTFRCDDCGEVEAYENRCEPGQG